MPDFKLTDTQVRFILSCIEDRRDVVLRKIDNLRKMNGSIDDELFEFIMEEHHTELHLMHQTVLTLQD
jgi:hypothetical protein